MPMAIRMHVDVVSAEDLMFSGQAEQLHIRGSEGDLGIFPRHTPLFTRIKPGLLRIVLPGGDEENFFVSTGFLEVQPHIVTILADTVLRSYELDEAAAQTAKNIEQAVRKSKLDQELQLSIALARTIDEISKSKTKNG